MAGESDLERTEAATSKQLEKARGEGDIPRSREASTCLVLLLGGSGVWMFHDRLVAALSRLMVAAFTFERAQAFDPALLSDHLAGYCVDVLISMAPIAGLTLIAVFISPMILGGFLFNLETIIPKFSKMNPINGIGNMFSLNSLVELGKAAGKAILVGSVAWVVISGEMDAMMGLGVEALSTSPAHLGGLIWHTFIMMVGVLVVIAAIDVPYQAWKYANKLKMTKEEVKQERKESDGDPRIKGKIRQLQRAMARRRMMAEVPKADVVVTNPSHYAVALKYSESIMGAPKVVAKGSDAVALRIRELAQEHGVAIMEAPPLARALHFHAELGDEIPESLYTAVAEVLAYVFQLRAFNTTGGVYPKLPHAIAVPRELDPLDPAYAAARARKMAAAAAAAAARAAQRSGSA
jgi:flagellar biosynthetic protein FlhB